MTQLKITNENMHQCGVAVQQHISAKVSSDINVNVKTGKPWVMLFYDHITCNDTTSAVGR